MAIVFIDNANSEEYFKFFTALQSKIDIIPLDTEATDLDPHTARMLLFQVGIKDDIFVFDIAKVGTDLLKAVLTSLINTRGMFIAHNAKFDIKLVKKETGILITKVHDTMTTEVMLNAGIGDTLYSLATLVERYCKVTLDKSERDTFVGMAFGESISANQIMYSATDVLYLRDIYARQMFEVRRANLDRIYDIESKLLAPVAMMEYYGVKADPQTWIDLEKKALENAEPFKRVLLQLIVDSIDFSKIENGLALADLLLIKEPVKTKRARNALELITNPEVIKQWAIDNFNVNSSIQMKNGLALLGIQVESTNEKIINKLPKHPATDALMSYREWNKLATTYGSNIADSINPVTGRVHTSYLDIGAASGRFSSRGPNLQNIPTNDDYRAGFIAEYGYSILSMDYSQQEFRLAGASSGEERIIDAYKRGADMHIATAAMMYKKRLEDVSKSERTFGKTLNFAILYGTTEWGLQRNLNVSLEEAKELISRFYAGYPRLSAFKTSVEERILELGYSVTPLGRRRYFPERPAFATPNEIRRWEASIRREGFNHIIQGGGADVVKLAINSMFYNNPFGEKLKLILQVHDEVDAEVHDSILKDAEEYMRFHMISVFEPLLRGIPAEVEAKVGKKWSK